MDDLTPLYGSIDIGTNSIKCFFARRDSTGHWLTVRDDGIITRLGAGMPATGHLTPVAMARTQQVLHAIVEDFYARGGQTLVAVGTMCLRTAANADEFLRLIQQTCGLTITVLSGEEEAWFAYRGVLSTLPQASGRQLIFDMGGGSTEFILCEQRQLVRHFSLNVGAVWYTEHFLHADPPDPNEIGQSSAAIDQDLGDIGNSLPCEALIGVGGGITTLAAVKHGLAVYDPVVIEGDVLTLDEINRQFALYCSKPLTERQRIAGLPPERADVMIAGTIIVQKILHQLGRDCLTVSTRGVRHGVFLDRFDMA